MTADQRRERTEFEKLVDDSLICAGCRTRWLSGTIVCQHCQGSDLSKARDLEEGDERSSKRREREEQISECFTEELLRDPIIYALAQQYIHTSQQHIVDCLVDIIEKQTAAKTEALEKLSKAIRRFGTGAL